MPWPAALPFNCRSLRGPFWCCGVVVRNPWFWGGIGAMVVQALETTSAGDEPGLSHWRPSVPGCRGWRSGRLATALVGPKRKRRLLGRSAGRSRAGGFRPQTGSGRPVFSPPAMHSRLTARLGCGCWRWCSRPCGRFPRPAGRSGAGGVCSWVASAISWTRSTGLGRRRSMAPRAAEAGRT